MLSIARQVGMGHGGARKHLARDCDLPVQHQALIGPEHKEKMKQVSSQVKTNSGDIIEGGRMGFVGDSHTLIWPGLI